jgi:hypothetical protein
MPTTRDVASRTAPTAPTPGVIHQHRSARLQCLSFAASRNVLVGRARVTYGPADRGLGPDRACLLARVYFGQFEGPAGGT